MDAVLEDAERERLRSKVETVEDLVERSHDEHPSELERIQERLTRRGRWYRDLENALLDLVNTLPAGAEDYEARQLFVYLTALRRAVEADSNAADETGAIEFAAQQMLDVNRRLRRRLEYSQLEDPNAAADFVFSTLDAVGATNLGRLLGVSTKTVGNWKAGGPVKQNIERVKLVAQLLVYLRYSMTQTGLLMWFDNPNDFLGQRSPRQLLDDGPIEEAWHPLVTYARGGRGQLG